MSGWVLISAVSFFLWNCAIFSPVESRGEAPFVAQLPPGKNASDLKWEEFEVDGRAAAEKFVAQRLEAISDLTSPDIDPYKGVDSVPSVCRKENLPPDIKTYEGEVVSVAASFYSSRRRILGLCTSPRDILRTQYLLLYCGGNRLYAIQYFYEPGEPWLKEPVARCVS